MDERGLRRFDAAGPTPDAAPGLAWGRFLRVREPSGRRRRNRGRAGRREVADPTGASGADPDGFAAGVSVDLVTLTLVAGAPVGFPVPTGARVGRAGWAGWAAGTSVPVGLPTGASLPVVSARVVVGGRVKERGGRVSVPRGALSFRGRATRAGRVALPLGLPGVPVGLAAVPPLSPAAAVNSLGGALLEWA
jgi:hypothetical protein